MDRSQLLQAGSELPSQWNGDHITHQYTQITQIWFGVFIFVFSLSSANNTSLRSYTIIKMLWMYYEMCHHVSPLRLSFNKEEMVKGNESSLFEKENSELIDQTVFSGLDHVMYFCISFTSAHSYPSPTFSVRFSACPLCPQSLTQGSLTLRVLNGFPNGRSQ